MGPDGEAKCLPGKETHHVKERREDSPCTRPCLAGMAVGMNNNTPEVSVAPPSLPKGGGAIQSIGHGWGAVGVSGAASLQLPLPISPGRGFAPALGLSYGSAGGRTEFGQ